MKRFEWLAQVINKKNYKKVVEVGTGKGTNAKYLLDHCPDIILIEVAYYPGEITLTCRSADEKAKRMWLRRIKPHRSRVDIIAKPSVEAAKKIKDQSVDVVFIDADHAYESVIQDVLAWCSKVKRGGLLCGHDYAHPRFPGVKRAVDEVAGQNVQAFNCADWVWWYDVK